MSFACKLCDKILPSRTGIWCHLKNKHQNQLNVMIDENKKKKRQQLDQFIINLEGFKPIQSAAGRPIDNWIELNQKIKEKQKLNSKDISLRTLTNIQLIEILKYITQLPREDLDKYIRNPENECSHIYQIPIGDEDSQNNQKKKSFLNRLFDFLTENIIEKLIYYLDRPDEIYDEQDEFVKLILQNSDKYSN